MTSPAGNRCRPETVGDRITASSMAATLAGIHGRNLIRPRAGGTSGLYQLASVITWAWALHVCAVIRSRAIT